MLEKRAYYAPGSVQRFWKLCRTCALFSELCLSHLNYAVWFLSEIKPEIKPEHQVQVFDEEDAIFDLTSQAARYSGAPNEDIVQNHLT